MRTPMIPDLDFARRIVRVQAELAQADLDVLVTYSSESEPASSRYLADFWPFFDFAGVVVPCEGQPALVTGGPESFEFARQFSRIKDIRINPLFVESSAPDWVPAVTIENFARSCPTVVAGLSRRIGVADWNIFPQPIYADLQRPRPGAEFVPADDILLRVQAHQVGLRDRGHSPGLLDHRTGDDRGAERGRRGPGGVGDRSARAHATMRRLGAEGTSYPIWVCSGPNTRQSLCRSTNRRIKRNELVQLTFGAAPHGLLRQHVPALRHRQGARPCPQIDGSSAGGRAGRYVISGRACPPKSYSSTTMTPWQSMASRSLPCTARRTAPGSSEVEGLWLGAGSETVIQPGMQFNVDVWLSDGSTGCATKTVSWSLKMASKN